MKILVTGAKGFVGKNLCAQLNNIKDGKARCYGDVTVEAVYEYDLDSTPEQLDEYCKNANFVFNLAGETVLRIRKSSCRATSALHRHCLIH